VHGAARGTDENDADDNGTDENDTDENGPGASPGPFSWAFPPLPARPVPCWSPCRPGHRAARTAQTGAVNRMVSA
jgi:hypothetical protein